MWKICSLFGENICLIVAVFRPSDVCIFQGQVDLRRINNAV
jgi:hypothetical protein